jgi:RNA polymerase sigma factor (sigma-70 family)
MMTSSEQENINQLVTDCAEGDEAALKRFFEIFSEDIYNFPLKVFHLTEDDAGDFFIFAFERLRSGKRFQSFKGKSSFKTWLYTVLRNLILDWKRNKHEVKIVNIRKFDTNGKEYSGIEDEPDLRPAEQEKADALSDFFYTALQGIRIENRVLFKIAYIYYLNLEEDEIQYILEKTGLSRSDLLKKIIEIREFLSDKEIESVKNEEKITAIYTHILDLKELKNKEDYHRFEDNLPNKDKVEVAIQKKYEQRRKLLEKKHKGLFLTRTPFKLITKLLQIPEGGISITLQRVVEKIQKNLDEAEI